MQITQDKIKEIVASAPKIGKKPKYRSLHRLIKNLRTDINAEISKYMQAWLVMLDESVKFFIYYEKYRYSLDLTAQTSPFAMQLSSVRSSILSIRELVLLGQTSSAQALCRNFIENIELLMALAEDADFAEAYSNAKNEEEFWGKNIGYGKLTPRVERFINLGVGENHVAHLAYHRKLKKFFSSDVHGSISTAFRTALPPSISEPGKFHAMPLGATTPNTPKLCRLIANETQLFSACVINIFTKENPPAALANYIVNESFNDFITSAHVLQELIVEFEDELIELEDSFEQLENTEYKNQETV